MYIPICLVIKLNFAIITKINVMLELMQHKKHLCAQRFTLSLWKRYLLKTKMWAFIIFIKNVISAPRNNAK